MSTTGVSPVKAGPGWPCDWAPKREQMRLGRVPNRDTSRLGTRAEPTHGQDAHATACLTLSLGLLSSLVFEKLPPHPVLRRIVIFCLLSGISYWLAGTAAAGIFALLTAIYRSSGRAWLAALLALPATVGLIWVLADYVLYLSPR